MGHLTAGKLGTWCGLCRASPPSSYRAAADRTEGQGHCRAVVCSQRVGVRGHRSTLGSGPASQVRFNSYKYPTTLEWQRGPLRGPLHLNVCYFMRWHEDGSRGGALGSSVLLPLAGPAGSRADQVYLFIFKMFPCFSTSSSLCPPTCRSPQMEVTAPTVMVLREVPSFVG